MHDFLKGPSRFSRSLPGLPHRRQAVETMRMNLARVVDYRRELGRRVSGSHLLVRLLQSLNVSLSRPDQEYVWAVQDVGLMVANTLRLTSIYGAGHLHTPGAFYGPEVSEVIIATIDDFDLMEARRNWQTLMPVRVLAHPYNDFTLPHLDGSGEGLAGGGQVVLSINVGMLAFQYKCWWEGAVRDISDSTMGVEKFLTAYPMANLLPAHMDITLANRIMARVLNLPILQQDDPNPFYVGFRTTALIEPLISETLEYLRRGNLSFDDAISAMPMASVADYHSWLTLPELAFQSQVEWAIFLARLPLMRFLLAWNAQIDSTVNEMYLMRIRIWIARMKNGRLFNQALRGNRSTAVLDEITQTIEPYL